MKKIILTMVMVVMAAMMITGCGAKAGTSTALEMQEFVVDELGVTYTYEEVDAKVDEFAKSDISETKAISNTYWYAEVSYGPYNIKHYEQGILTSLFNAPTLFDKEVGDTVKITIASKYKDGELVERKVAKIH